MTCPETVSTLTGQDGRFLRSNRLEDLTLAVRECAKDGVYVMFIRAALRLNDLKLNPRDLDNGLKTASVTNVETPPNRCEIRLEICSAEGDIKDYTIIAYLSNNGMLYIEDFRDSTSGRGK